MQVRMRPRRWAIGALVATTAVGGVLAPAPAQAKSKAKQRDVTVMTRNVYLGADIFRPVKATAGKSGLDALNAFGNANWTTRQIVDQTDFRQRAKLLAGELHARKPDLVGLQEVATWRRGPFDISHLGTPTATKVDYDFLKLLLAAAKKAGTPYHAVRVQQESDVEAPAFPGSYSTAAADGGFNARLTMHDVILRRKGSPVRIRAKHSKQYKADYVVSLSGVEFKFIRGYLYADAQIGKRKFRFIDTHLESARSDTALAQAKELMKGPIKGAGRKPVVMVCDCNSDPLDKTIYNDGDIPHWSTYKFLRDKLADEWLKVKTAKQGYSSGLSETVNENSIAGIDHRIDLVLGRGFKAIKGWRTGTRARSKSGLWASDHMGIAVKLRP